MGISCSSEIFQREIRNILFGIDGQINISDDILIFANTIEEHDIILNKIILQLLFLSSKMKQKTISILIPVLIGIFGFCDYCFRF